MPRSIQICASSDKTDEVLQRVRGVDGVVGLVRQRDASVKPPGDVLTIQATNDASRKVMDVLQDIGVVESGGSIQSSALRSVISEEHRDQFDQESNETTWDEMAFLLRLDTNSIQNYFATMFLAGAVCAVGLWTDTLHLIIASMVIAAAFEPLVRIPFGLIAGPRSLTTSGLVSTGAGYAMLAVGGALALLLLQVVDPTADPDLSSRRWVGYWSEIPVTGVIVSVFASAAGTVILCGQRAVLTTGVMIALALVPSMCVAGMGLAAGDPALAGEGLLRWLVDAGLVLGVSGVVLLIKRSLLHHRRALG